jgi:hypothetical protein
VINQEGEAEVPEAANEVEVLADIKVVVKEQVTPKLNNKRK